MAVVAWRVNYLVRKVASVCRLTIIFSWTILGTILVRLVFLAKMCMTIAVTRNVRVMTSRVRIVRMIISVTRKACAEWVQMSSCWLNLCMLPSACRLSSGVFRLGGRSCSFGVVVRVLFGLIVEFVRRALVRWCFVRSSC